mmetsp:Transcript_15925/g.23489  ORF Transcript_15925/g.23489 Transcript_15925/m.23489 type:complete len:222 (+) Transcript_15925:26-691(+)
MIHQKHLPSIFLYAAAPVFKSCFFISPPGNSTSATWRIPLARPLSIDLHGIPSPPLGLCRRLHPQILEGPKEACRQRQARRTRPIPVREKRCIPRVVESHDGRLEPFETFVIPWCRHGSLPLEQQWLTPKWIPCFGIFVANARYLVRGPGRAMARLFVVVAAVLPETRFLRQSALHTERAPINRPCMVLGAMCILEQHCVADDSCCCYSFREYQFPCFVLQ